MLKPIVLENRLILICNSLHCNYTDALTFRNTYNILTNIVDSDRVVNNLKLRLVYSIHYKYKVHGYEF